MDAIVATVGPAQIALHPRHPYAGELVCTAFSGSHQDAIASLAAENRITTGTWLTCPSTLPIWSQLRGGDPHQQPVRQGGVTHLLERDLGLQLPRWLQIDFSRRVQAEAEASSSEISPEQIRTPFEQHYLEPAHGYHRALPARS